MIRTEPWLVQQSIEFIKDYLITINTPNILEFGTGYSTIWFCKQFKCNIVSVDHDGVWHNNIKNQLKEYSPRLILRPSEVVSYEDDLLKKSYADIADEFDDEFFDLVLIDGRNRVDCFNRSERTLKTGGIMMLDNSERSEYNEIIQKYSGKECYEFEQTIPDNYGFMYGGWKTTIWIK